jgi:hypothetical protein
MNRKYAPEDLRGGEIFFLKYVKNDVVRAATV